MLKKIWEVILYIITFGYRSYALYRKERRKVEALYACIQNELQMADRIIATVRDGNVNVEDIAKWVSRDEMERRLKAVQDANGLLKDIKADVKTWKLKK